MNDEEIMEALECCGELYNICAECPMPNNIKDDCRCGEHLANYALDLINRQQAEIERLKNENKILSKNADTAFQDGLNEAQDLYAEQVKDEIKSKAVREFAERLKKSICERLSDGIKEQNPDLYLVYAIIEDLEKKMPQKPTIDEYDDGTYSYICPCGAEVEENQVYCDICGQALDWGKEEEG